jgi:hypothetical protein
MSNQRFLLYLEMNGSGFILKCEGENWTQEFRSLVDALQGARSLADNTDARLTVFDHSGRPIIETFV